MRPLFWGLALLVLVCGPWHVIAGEEQQEQKNTEPVELQLFSAIDNGQISVAVVPHNFSVMTVRVRNNMPSDVKVELPKTFAAIPATRWQTQQMLQQQGASASLASRYAANQGGSQGLGGGSLAGPWVNSMHRTDTAPANAAAPNQEQPQFWLIGARKKLQFQVPCFCLEFGKPDPNRHIPYRICQVEQLNEKPAVKELLAKFSQGNVDQWVAQLAAWHVATNTPWQMLARVKPPRHSSRQTGITPRQALLAAKNLSESLPSYGRQSSLGSN